MATIQIINVSTPNDGLGDTLRNSQVKANDNFAELNLKKVEVVPGMGLSSNDYTTAEQTKLSGIEEDAEVNVQADWNEEDPGSDAFILNKPAISGGLFVMDGIVGTTSGFTDGQTVFILPSEDVVVERVFLNAYPQWLTTSNNTSLVGRWSQTGDELTLTTAAVTDDYIYIEYR